MTFRNDFLLACAKKKTSRIPVWFMRQAGRYQPEYRALRKKYDMLTCCRNPALAAEITLFPVRQMDVDAAILFSDIMIPLAPLGVDFEIKEGIGPVIANPVRSLRDINALLEIEPEISLSFVGEAIKLLRKELQVPLIGFCGAPFTLASYMLEGKPSKNFTHTRRLMYSDEKSWNLLMEKLVKNMIKYLHFQAESGAQALQIFDSWVGNLDAEDYKRYIFPHMIHLFSSLKELQIPLIHFGVGTAHLLPLIKQTECTVIGIDSKIPIDEAWQKINYEQAIQGNLEPAVLLGSWKIIEEKTLQILDKIKHAKRNGFIFNLGHGVLPETQPEILRQLVDLIHQYDMNE